MMIPRRPASAVQWARVFIHPALKNGSTAVDATAGNGLDTLFLAEGVGRQGRVYALDIQDIALEKTSEALKSAGLLDRVTVLKLGHQEMDRLVPDQADAVMFNLGYLPGSDRSVLTMPGSTGDGIKAALKILGPGGRISVLVYTGHPGSGEESRVVGELLSNLDQREFTVQKMVFWNSCKNSPELYFVTRSGEKYD